MTPAEPVSDECRPEATTPRLEDLIPIAVVISVGCEGCAGSMVRRALRRGSVQPVIERTLEIVQQAGSADCLLRAVGPDVIARMKKALRAARKTLSEGSPRPAGRQRWDNFEPRTRREGS